MKIFNNFDTSKHKTKFINLSNEMWDGKVLSFKKHSFCLISSFVYYLISITWFGGVLFSLNLQFATIQWISLTYIVLTSMIFILWSILLFIGYFRVFLNHSVGANCIKNADNLDNRFEVFLKVSLYLFVCIIILISSSIILDIYLSPDISIHSLWAIFLHIFSCFIYLLWVYLVVYRILDFDMSYCLVTPSFVELNLQIGFFKRKNTIIQTPRLTMISVMSKWILQSIFKYGELHFLTDWGSEEERDLRMNFVPRPYLLKNTLNSLLILNEKE